MKRMIASVTSVVLVGTIAAGTVAAGQTGGVKNCGSQWIKTSGTGQGNQSHTVGSQGQTWTHPINGTNYSHTFFSTLSYQSWTVTTGGPLSSAAANCWFN